MFSNKPNVNLLTALLVAHDIQEVVVCPGSRNAPLVHNLYVSRKFCLHPITDERSAAFVGIGLWLKTRRPVVVTVTSGSALLNTLPGVAEASFRHIPLIIVSADRPEQWIGQLDGQTLPQPGALAPFAPSWQLIEPHDVHGVQHCERLINEALNSTANNGGQPIHINLPISEPLFLFNEKVLPAVRKINVVRPMVEQPLPDAVIERISASRLPLLLIGQYEEDCSRIVARLRDEHKMLVYAEILSGHGDMSMAALLDSEVPKPDLVVHVGGAMVNKDFKLHLRSMGQCSVIRIAPDDELPDTFLHLDTKICVSPKAALRQLAERLPSKAAVGDFFSHLPSRSLSPVFEQIEALFLGNSTAVRWANRHFSHIDIPVYGNRGTNGIEGSLSVAAGYALLSSRLTLCILGDLSFFYDVNALWNEHLGGQLRVLLINNARGEIFHHLPGLSESPALPHFVAAAHSATARGIAESYRCAYLSESVDSFDSEADRLIHRLTEIEADRPVILEVFITPK